MPSQTKENYLKAIYFLSQKDKKVSLSELGKQMQVSTPTANSMVKKLQEHGWIEYQKYKPLVLTDKGKKVASLIIRKHRLTEMFLVKIMNMGWEEVHDIAEELEHIQSPLLFERMDEMLGHPEKDPHGSPIPNKEGQFTPHNYTPLSQIKEGKKVVVKAIEQNTDELLRFLNHKNIQLGTSIDVKKVESFDGSMYVKLSDKEDVLTKEVTSRLLVEEK